MAVYTEIPDSDLVDYLTHYDIGELHSLKGIAEGVENSNYLLSTDAGMHILTLYEKRVNREDLPFFLTLKQHLSKNGVTCPKPVAMKNGEILGELADRPSAIITFLDGNSVKRPAPSHCEQVGSAIAQMHLAGEGFALSRKNALGPEDWSPLFQLSRTDADSIRPGLTAFIDDEIEYLQSNWPHHLPSGVIHADLFPDNVFFLKGQLSGLIDFYFACNDLFAYDVSICLNAWCFEADYSFNVTKAARLLKGYNSIRKLSDEEIACLPVLARGSALRFLLTRLYDWLNVPPGALVTPKDPTEYIEKLKFHGNISNPVEYGLALL